MGFVGFASVSMRTREIFLVSGRQVGKNIAKMTKIKNTKKTTTNYPIGDFLIRVKNAAMAGNKHFSVPSTKMIYEVASVMKKMDYLSEVVQKDDELSITLSYFSKEPVLMNLKLISRPGYRRYVSVNELIDFKGPQKYILSTPKGIMSSSEAVKNHTGGELIVEIL